MTGLHDSLTVAKGRISHASKKSRCSIQNVLGLQIIERKIILDSSQRPQKSYKEKKRLPATWTECYEA